MNTTLHPAALPDDRAAGVLNCDTSRGIWERDARYRRFKTKPVRNYTTGGPTTFSTGDMHAATCTAVARTGGNKTFTNPSNALSSDDSYAQASAISPGDATEILYANTFTPGAALPTVGVTALTGKIRIEAQIDPDTGLATDVVDDYIYLLKSGVAVSGNLATNAPIEITDTVREYAVDFVALGITPADINNGLVGVKAAWSALPTSSTAFNGANWSIGIAPASPQSVHGAGARTESNPFTVTATWIGAGAAPTYVLIKIDTGATGSGQATPPFATMYSGTATVTDGYGHTTTGSIEAPTDTYPASLSITGTQTFRRPIAGGAASQIVTPTATSSVTGTNQESVATTTCSASVVAPSPTTLKVDAITLLASYTVDTSVTVELVGPRGIGFGSFGSSDEVSVVWGQGAFKLSAGNIANPSLSAWSAELSGKLLQDSPWFIWQYGKWLFYTNPDDGVYYRTIGATDWTALAKDSQSPGSTGDASFQIVKPPYDEHQVFVSGTDTITGAASGPTLSTPGAEITTEGWVRVNTNDWGSGYKTGYLEFEVTLVAGDRDLSKAMCLGFEIQSLLDDGTTSGGNDGFYSPAANNKVTLTNNAGTGVYGPVTPKLYGRFNKATGTYYGWLDLSGVSSTVLSTLHKIKIRFGIYQTGRSRYKLNKLYAGGMFYHDTGSYDTRTPTTDTQLEYAYNYTEGATVGQSRTLNVAASQHLGSRPFSVDTGDGGPYPYLGGVVGITVPVADAPFTSAAKINIYRKVGANWQRIAQSTDNSEAFYFEDRLRDSVIAASTGTYPITVLNFDAVAPIFSGVATDVVCGCAWKGSNVYSGNDGKIYFSRTNAPFEVLWDNVVLTNDPGSDDLGPARTSVLADNTADYALCLVPAENLYCFTKRECYVFVAGDTAFTASYPRKIDGVRGALGVRAACVFGDRALVGCVDGLWVVKKSSDVGQEPDELIELTADNRGAWQSFIGQAPDAVVVRQHLGEIWCWNGGAYYHITRVAADGERRHILGRYADGRGVVDAYSDPAYGLLVQLSDGAVGVVGDYPTDGGLLVAGTDGVAPIWTFTGPRADLGGDPKRAAVWVETDGSANVSLSVTSEEGTDSIGVAGTDLTVEDQSFERLPSGQRLGGATHQFVITGGAYDRVRAVDVEITERGIKR